eukprot:scaffold112825_cov30-Phaeocystis_antarctica.AAC.1
MDPVENDDAGTAGRVCSWNWTCKKIERAQELPSGVPELLRPFTPTSAGAGEAQQPLPNGATDGPEGRPNVSSNAVRAANKHPCNCPCRCAHS